MGLDIDIFVSYRRSDAEYFATLLVDRLTSYGYSVFFDHDSLKGGDFRHGIEAAVDSCTDFIVVLSPDSLAMRIQDENDLMRTEIAHAIKTRKNIVGVATRGWQGFPEELPEELNTLRWIQYISCGDIEYREEVFRRLTSGHDFLQSNPRPSHVSPSQYARSSSIPADSVRRSNRYWEKYHDTSQEEIWLRDQETVLQDFDCDVYDRLLSNTSNLAVLDIGCGTGLALMDRLGNRPEVAYILGVDSNPAAVKTARERYQSTPECQVEFECMDCEAPDFSDKLDSYLRTHDLDGFDFVNITMTLMHLRSPFTVLSRLRGTLADGAQFFVRDIDDGLNIAYQDENNDFARLNTLVSSLPTTGCRVSGRQLFGAFTHAGYKDVRLQKAGLSTAGMGFDGRRALFEASFGWLRGDLEVRCNSDENNESYRQDLLWYDNNIDSLREKFQAPDFFYQEGYVIFTARYSQEQFGSLR